MFKRKPGKVYKRLERKPWTKRVSKKAKLNRKRDKVTKQTFIDNPFCEKCGSHFNLRRAHRKKRRFIGNDDPEYFEVVILCEKCDVALEHGGHERLFEETTKLIQQRDTRWNDPP